MPKSAAKITFLCQDCGHTSPKWEGRCPACHAWGTYVEFAQPKPAVHGAPNGARPSPTAVPLREQPDGNERRTLLGMPEVDRLLGGGIVAGSGMLLAGDPGVGKSTLLLQIAALLAGRDNPVLYISGEESGAQVRLRAQRVGADAPSLLFASETSAEAIVELWERERPTLAVVDSIQTLTSDRIPSSAGSVAQVRDCAQRLLAAAKASGVPLFLAGHVTKDGSVAGPRVLEHMVDVVLYLDGEEASGYRVLRCTKNRFGSTNDVALLEMRADGLAEVADPSAALIGERREDVPGSAVIVTLEGSRPLLSEVQALTNLSTFTPPRRSANGLDFNRVVMLTAVLTRRSGLALGGQDIMVNVPGGLRLGEPAADLGAALAIASSFLDRPLPGDTVYVGEVGLNGEVRRVGQVERRLAEAARHGFRRALIPAGNAPNGNPPGAGEVHGLRVVSVEHLRQAMAECGLSAGARPDDIALSSLR